MLLAIALVTGLVAGILIGRWTRDRRAAPPSGPSPAPIRSEAPDSLAALLDEAADQVGVGLVVAAPDGTVVYRNRAASALSGTHAGVILDERLDAVLDSARGGEGTVASVELHGPPTLVLALAAEPMPGGGAVATVHDVSERARIDAVRTDFVANVSHELKTPVGAIAVLAETLVDETDPAVVARVAERMVDEAHRAARTIDDLLELSRIESDRTDHDVVELNAIVHAAIARGRIVDDGRGIRVRASDGNEPVRLRADARQLVSALGNLVENAVKYSFDGGVVEVGTGVGRSFVEVTVTDQGVGIPQRDLDRVFERFYRVDKARNRQTGGTGLGLAIVRHVATNHGGEVVVSSSEGAGSSFVLRLPVSLVVTDGPDSDGPSSDGPGGDDQIDAVEGDGVDRRFASPLTRDGSAR